jgi:hypothetical protein
MSYKNEKDVIFHNPIELDQRERYLRDLREQIVGDIRARFEELKRSKLRVTQKDIAQALGSSPSSVNKILMNDSNLTIKKIADVGLATGSVCHFRMVRDPNSSVLPREAALKLEKSSAERKTRLASTELLDVAASYVRNIFGNMGLIEDCKFEVQCGKEKTSPGIIEIDGADDQDWDRYLEDLKLRISPEFCFKDGHAEVEWVLLNSNWEEQFRQRDLHLVAAHAAVMLSRRVQKASSEIDH